CLAAVVAERAVSSYLAFSPLPDPKIVGGVFSVALSGADDVESLHACVLRHSPSRTTWIVRAQALSGSAPKGARTFLGRLDNIGRDHPVGTQKNLIKTPRA